MSTIRVYTTMTRKKRNSFLFIRGRWASTSAASRLQPSLHWQCKIPFVVWDVIHRFLEHEGYDVTLGTSPM